MVEGLPHGCNHAGLEVVSGIVPTVVGAAVVINGSTVIIAISKRTSDVEASETTATAPVNRLSTIIQYLRKRPRVNF